MYHAQSVPLHIFLNQSGQSVGAWFEVHGYFHLCFQTDIEFSRAVAYDVKQR